MISRNGNKKGGLIASFLNFSNAKRFLIVVSVVSICIFFYKMGGLILAKLERFLGLAPKLETEETKALNKAFDEMKSAPGVNSQLTPENTIKAELIFDAINGYGYDIEALRSVFKTITGPNQMKAVSIAFGVRTVSFMFIINHTGTLESCMRYRLLSYYANQFQKWFNWLK